MSYNEFLTNRTRKIIVDYAEKHVDEEMIFGGFMFVVDDKICAIVKTSRLLVKIVPEPAKNGLRAGGCHEVFKVTS